NFKGTKHTAGFIGTLPREWTLDEIYEKLAAYMPLDVEIISATKEQTCIFVLCTNAFKDNVFETLRAMDFTLPSISFEKAPAEQLKDFEKQAEEIKGRINTYMEEMKSYDKSREDMYFLLDYETIRIEKYDVIGNLLQSKNVFIITGFIPEKDAKHIEEELTSKFDLAVEVTEPKKKDQVPVLYKNNGFCEPLEGIVNSFSPPGKGEIDPTMVMSLFYYMLFGLMLSDAGYGFLMAAGCAFALYKFRNTMERSMKNTLKMYLYCGISTVFWGIMFGSYFGDIFDVVGTTFFGVEKVPVIPPLWFFPVEKPMLMLTFCMAVGIFHLLIGLAMKGYQAIKHKDYKSLVYDAVFWITLLISCVLLLLSMEMIKNILGINIELPAYAVKAAGILAIISAAGIILTNGRESKNPFKRILKGLYALYGISGYLSDVLSYSRLLALGLATGVIGSVINKMAAMAAGGFFGPVIFTVIVIIGHALNIGINALGAYVHTNRLQYVEFFGKFYEGGGTLFKPFGMHTKYYKIKD
ncbi:MAG TPA: V-type ATP synthase subunit I, partial [Mobilitalea sp.]|nr:V-type ATP synthase subunit I [Mobilitalea sp.]